MKPELVSGVVGIAMIMDELGNYAAHGSRPTVLFGAGIVPRPLVRRDGGDGSRSWGQDFADISCRYGTSGQLQLRTVK